MSPFIPPFGSPPGGAAGASIELDNLGTTAINTSLISDTDSTDDLGSSDKFWANLYVDTIHLQSGFNNFVVRNNSGSALAIENESSNLFYTLDTRSTQTSIRTHMFDRKDTSTSFTTTFNTGLLKLSGWNLELTGGSGTITMSSESLRIERFFVSSNVATVTFNEVNCFSVSTPYASTNAVIVDTSAIRVSSTQGKGINQYGLYIPNLTGGTSKNTGVYIKDASGTGGLAIWVDAGLSRFDGDGTHVFELPVDATDPTGGGGAAAGRIPVIIGGATKYIPYY